MWSLQFQLFLFVSILNISFVKLDEKITKKIISGDFAQEAGRYVEDNDRWVWGGGSTRSQSDSLKAAKECGVSPAISKRTGGRIVGGRKAIAGEYPWQVALLQKNLEGKYSIICGGAILNERWIITAAHCTKDVKESDLKVAIGTHDVTHIKQEDEFFIDKLVVHKKYVTGSQNEEINDIAMLRTSKPMDLSKSELINSVCLPRSGERFVKAVEVSGWGKTHEFGRGSRELRTVEVYAQPDSVCRRIFKEKFHVDSMFCAGSRRGGKDACEGDSGGPIVKVRNGKAYLAGVVSFGVGCARKGYSGVYTRVSSYVDWINDTMRE